MEDIKQWIFEIKFDSYCTLYESI